MEDVQEGLDQENASNENMTGLGADSEEANASGDAEQTEQAEATDDPYSVKKRLGMQAKKHQRELRSMQEQLMRMQHHLEQTGQHTSSNANSHESPGQPNGPSGTEEERITRAVRMALGEKEAQERKAKDAERLQHVQKKYMALHDEFDRASEKYDDFDDVVRGHDVPFTPAIRDALLFIDNPADVAYKLGKNRQELQRISELHPLDQAREVNKLAFALMGGGSANKAAPNSKGPMGQIRANPNNSSSAVTDKTPPSAIRARMKAGTWK